MFVLTYPDRMPNDVNDLYWPVGPSDSDQLALEYHRRQGDVRLVQQPQLQQHQHQQKPHAPEEVLVLL